ncbi:MAG: pilus assembly protein TadE [Ilumatobacteraceae bacterium]|nr:pilus assembly protein TadE [Ilumatobacteraceae bacterium]
MTNIKQHGSVTVELVLLTPIIFLLGFFIVFLGRSSGAQMRVQHAADVGARAASMASSTAMSNEAKSAALSDLGATNTECIKPAVVFKKTQQKLFWVVTVTVKCTINADGLTMLGAQEKTVFAESTEYVDVYTAR